MPKFLFVGLGSIGRRHAQNLYTLGYRDFFAYRTTAAVDEFEKAIGITRVSSYEAGLALAPDAVFVTNPTAFHVRDAIAAVSAGCHVFVEKPLGASLEGVRELQNLAREKQRAVYVGYHLRFHPVLLAIREVLVRGEFGAPLAAHLEVAEHLADWHPGEDHRQSYAARRDLGGGVILTLSHELDYAHWLFGEVHSVSCLGGTRSDLVRDVEDTATMLCEFSSGLAATIHLDYLQRPPARSLKVVCEKGKIEWDYFSPGAKVFSSLSPGARPRELLQPPGFEKNQMYVDEVAHFVRVIAGAEQPRVSLPSAIYSLQLALAALQSLGERRLVAVPQGAYA